MAEIKTNAELEIKETVATAELAVAEAKVADKAQNDGGTPATSDALLAKLDAIERLLARQAESEKKQARGRMVTSALLACLVLVLAAGLLWLNSTVSTATRQLPQLLTTAEETLRQADQALRGVNELDIAALNDAIEEMGSGLGAVDFEALNESILDLQKVAEGLANLTSIFR